MSSVTGPMLWRLVLALSLLKRACSFAPLLQFRTSPFTRQQETTTRLYFRHTDNSHVMLGQNSTDAVMIAPSAAVSNIRESHYHQRRRELLKRQLAAVAIEDYRDEQQWYPSLKGSSNSRQTSTTMTAEDIMRQLEDYCPVARPVHQPELLNARWSFCFTGVPTIGMKLITLLSRLSSALRPIEFHNVYLDVYDQQSRVKAVVRFAVLGFPMELNVHTALAPRQDDDDDATHLWETFQSIALNGVTLPTPKSWQKSRDLEIRYVDQDFMIARTAGGEPHLLLRHSPCGTDNVSGYSVGDENVEECDIDADLTDYFATAQSKYGERGLARSLVDRAYGETDHAPVEAAASIPQLVQSILTGDGSHASP